jgi:hypothetical protein
VSRPSHDSGSRRTFRARWKYLVEFLTNETRTGECAWLRVIDLFAA